MRAFSQIERKSRAVPREVPVILAFGDNVVDCYTDLGTMYPGGNCLNLAAFARRFGARSGYAGAVADDAAGRLIRRALDAEDVDTALLRTLPGRTAYCVITSRGGEREFVCADLGVSIVAPSPADLARMSNVNAVHTGRSSHVDAWLGHIAARTALSYDFATVQDPARIAAVAPHCFLASFSGGELDREAALHLAIEARAAGALWALVTRGAAGAILAGPQGSLDVAAPAVAPVDTLGAGDTFIARTLVGLLRGEPGPLLLAAAAREAAATCLVPGAFGHGAAIEIDRSEAKTIDEIYRTTRPAPAPAD